MNILSVVISLWGVSVLAFVALMVYRATLTQHETDQLFLSDEVSMSNGHMEHDDIVRKVNGLRPYCQGVGGFAALTTVALVGTYIAQNVAALQ